MIGLDTNALIRLLTEDDAAQAASVRRRLAKLDQIAESVLINNVVLVETLWVLTRVYGFDRHTLQMVLEKLLSASTFGFEDRSVVTTAFAHFQTTTADFSDCLIAAQNAQLGCDVTITFDRGMAQLPMVEVLQAKSSGGR